MKTAKNATPTTAGMMMLGRFHHGCAREAESSTDLSSTTAWATGGDGGSSGTAFTTSPLQNGHTALFGLMD